MRLWHEDLIKKLPNKQLLGQWRECLALLGNGWGKKHSVVNYVFDYNESKLVGFAFKVADEMIERGYKPNRDLIIAALRRRNLTYKDIDYIITEGYEQLFNGNIYPEHNKQYLEECINNLKNKGVVINANC